jgi:hypothetical protein
MNIATKLAAVGATLAGVALLLANATGAGDSANYKFSKSPVNAMGVQGIADLRGKPILIDFWGEN